VSSGEKRRFELRLQYDGTGFHGWQVQPGLRTVQGELEVVLTRITGGHRAVTGSGRTDAGVHATGQVASVDVPDRWDAESLRSALNALSPRDVWVEAARQVPADFHARYDAVARTYRYRVGLAAEAFSPFHRPYCWPLRDELDATALRAAARLLPGERSFRAFATAGQPERGDRCRVQVARWTDWEGIGLEFTITADRYLRHMVRYLVGTMVDVGRGRRALEDLGILLGDSGGDLITSPPAPPEGLYLDRVEYPPQTYVERRDTDQPPRAQRAPSSPSDIRSPSRP
jgi:tRNA pseudouridine38-40 synthase